MPQQQRAPSRPISCQRNPQREAALQCCQIRGVPPDLEVVRFCSGQSAGLLATTPTHVTSPTVDKPKPVLTREPAGEILEGDTVTLSCVVEGGSDGWSYLWYKGSQHSTPVYQTDSSSGTGAGYTISPAALSHSGEYWCRAERGSNLFNSDYSSAVNIQVSELFTSPALTVMPDASVWEGETVTLQCGALINKQGTQLQYHYIKDNGNLRGAGSRDPYSIPAAQLRDTGSYQCEVEAAGTGVKKMSDIVSLTVKERPQAVLTQEPAWTQIFRSERVTLRCQVQGDYTDWRVTWYKAGKNAPVTQDYYSRIDGDRYTISSATQYHSGEYTCKGERTGNPSYSKTSDALTLRVSERPQAVLTQEPAWTQIYESERITLRCEVQGGYTDWRFTWYVGNGPVTQDYYSRIDDKYTISSATRDHSGEYTCKGERTDNPSYSKTSNALTLRVSAGKPKSVLTQEPAGEIFEGDTVTLSCVVEGGSDGWKYRWYKGSQYSTSVYWTDSSSGTGAGYTISPAALNHSGYYWCRAERGSNLFNSDYSSAVNIQVSERPKAVLTQEPAWTQIYKSESVTLRCQVQGDYTDWRVTWYKAGRNAPVTQNSYSSIDGDRYTISSATKGHSGEYTCKGERTGNPSYSKTSDALTLRVSAGKPKPVLTQEPAGEIFEGDTVTLSCVVEGGSGGWRYLWYKDKQYSTPVNQTDSSSGTGAGYTISAAALSHSGEYWCGAERGRNPFNSDYSNAVNIQVSELPQTTLTLEPPFPEIFTGETVTLRCAVKGGSAGWKYLWYKDSEVTPVLQTADRSITGDSYTITAAAVSDQGQYCCRGQRGDQPLYSQLSDKVILTVSEVHPKAVLTLHPAWAQIFTGETVTLSCEVEGGSAGWRFKQYRDGREEAGCSDQYSRRDEDSCTISNAQHYHSGVYWCESASGQERSNAVNLTVSNEWVILQTPLQPAIEGDSLTLRCRVRTNYTFTRIVFFKDNEEIQSPNNTELSVDRVSKSDEGSYKCRAMWNSSTYSGDSAEVRVSVRELFSRVTLTASPGATVKEGEALNLTCEAAVNKTPRPQLHYTIVRDGEPVTNSTDSALYSIASTEKSHTGSYTCAVESQGVKKSSQELHIELQTSWHSAVAIGYRVSFTLIHFIVFTLLLLQYCRIQGSLCIAGGTSRKTSDQDQEQSAERIELCSRVQHTGVELQ
ncbi:Fc receptor-like protein 5 [Acipenser ruthenus]|uniref:Fc receptor-like protein 5 n=1 Tax=Acipenser ruthenus TaxID=7906 RepID=UPI00274120F0|nr:Fc receptor-like protein 5 [Acipenser ruthenus]